MKVLLVILLLVGYVFHVSCSSAKPAAAAPEVKVSRIAPSFDYTPPRQEKVASAGVTIALVSPQYVAAGVQYGVSPFKEMAENMNNDFNELLTAKGFTIRGPFSSKDKMVFNDKRNSDFVLQVEIDVKVNCQRESKTVTKKNWGNILVTGASLYEYSYKYSGGGSIGGKLVLTALSPSYSEKLWTKNIDMDNIPFSYTGSQNWTTDDVTLYDEYLQDAQVYNILVQALQKYYQAAFELTNRHIEVAEMKSVAEESKKADKKG